jgi:Ser/Thr protein kinase RdoA (MazF antagonist)
MNRLIIGRWVWCDAMVDEQGWGGFERRPDVDGVALGALLRRVLGPGLRVDRTPAGVAAQVYRVDAAERVLYVRIAEEDHEDLSVDAALLEHLRAEGLRVPQVVHVEPFDQDLGRSVLIMSEIAGAPLAHCRDEGAARRVARAAGRELAVLNRVRVQGFGWVQRRAPVWPLRGTFQDYAEFVVSDLPDPWPGPLASLFSTWELERFWSLVAGERRRELGGARLAHGDFDPTPIFQADGRYSGLIDFGEIRGTEPLFDLGHFCLHDREHTPIPLLGEVLAGYGDVASLPAGHEELVRRSAALLGLRQLARWLGPFRNLRPDHPAATGRAARLRQLLVDPDVLPDVIPPGAT